MATYAYRLPMPKGRLSFGLQFGIKHMTFDSQKMDVQDPDYSFSNLSIQPIIPDANFGIYYSSKIFYAGVSSKQLFENTYGMAKKNDTLTFTRLTRHFYGMSGIAIPLSEQFTFKPSALIKFVPHSPVQADFNLSLVYSDLLWFGISYRTDKALVTMFELRLTKQLRFGYSYDMEFNMLQKGTHELRLGLDLELFQNRMLTPRYFF
jgi:type IX secretion system PorP/SprF family membrane protein